MEYGEIVYACALNQIFNHRAIISRQLLEHFTFPSEIFSLSRKDLEREIGIPTIYCEKILDKSLLEWANKEVDWCNKHKVRLIYLKDPDYPYRLKQCIDAPTILYYKGSCSLNADRVIALVGTRKPSEYSLLYCRKIIKELSTLTPKPLIISGLAYGIDINTHRESLRLGLDTIGVMGTGINTIYPRTHRDTAIQMLEHGGIITDFCTNYPTLPQNFIKRNRIIAGLSDATILLESRLGGGGATTAKLAFQYNRDVFALPGTTSDKNFEGSNKLIAENIASIITSETSTINALGWQTGPLNDGNNHSKTIRDSDSPQKKAILQTLLSGIPLNSNSIQFITKLSISELSIILTELEIENRIVYEHSKYRLI